MLFLEDLYANKRPYPKPDPRRTGRKPRAPRREPPIAAPEQPRNAPEPPTAPAPPTEHRERASSTKRNSFFSRRKSTATNSSTESPKRNSSAHSGGAGSQRSSLVEAPPADGETSKASKYLFGLHSSKKSRKSDPPQKPEADRGRSGHSRGASADSVKESFGNSAPFGFHSIGFDRSRGAPNDRDVAQQRPAPLPPFVSSPPDELQSSLARRVQRRPPPLRPKRPEEALFPELISPQYGIPSLRQIRSAEAVGPPPLRPAPPPPVAPRVATAPLPPRRSSKRISPSFSDDLRGMQYGLRGQPDVNRDWERATALYDQGQTQQAAKARPLPIHGSLPAVPGTTNSQVPGPLPSPLFSPPLAQVPEEPEGVNSPRRRRSKDSTRMASIRHAKSTPNISRSASQTKPAPVVGNAFDRPTSQGSDTLGELACRPTVIQCGETVKRFGFPQLANTSWEDDIEFCYENSAEADCEFDWTGGSKFVDMESSDDDRWAPNEIVTERKKSLGHQPNSSMDSSSSDEESLTKSILWPRAALPNAESPPELDFQSIHTSSSNSLAARTPRDPFRFPSNEGLRQQLANQRKADMASPQLPPIVLKTEIGDNVYEDLMVGINAKDAQSLPTLEPKTYTRPGQPAKRVSPLLSHRAYNIGAPPSMSLPPLPTSLPPPPTSQPTSSTTSPALSMHQSPTSTYGSPSLSSVFGKDLPPLPLTVPTSTRSNPPTVDSIIARLRSPTESPVDPRMHPSFTPPQSNKSSPVPYYMTTKPQQPSPTSARRPPQRTESPITKLQQQGFPEVLSRNGSEDTVVTTIFVPPSPPQSPAEQTLHQLSASTTATTRSVPSSAASSVTPVSARPSADDKDRLPLLPQLSVPEAPRRSASDAGSGSPVAGGSAKPQTATDPKQGYSLFPQSPRPTRPRRGTTA